MKRLMRQWRALRLDPVCVLIWWLYPAVAAIVCLYFAWHVGFWLWVLLE